MKKVSDEKKKKMRETLLATKEKRKHQRPEVFELKIDYSHLNKSEIEILKMYFIEAKWIYNYILSLEKPFDFDSKTKVVLVKNKEGIPEERKLKYLPAKNRQDVHNILKFNIKGLSESKKKGNKVGKLKFKSEYNSIELSQNGVTHKITGRNRIKVNGIKRPLIVRGLEQVKSEYEIANAKLIKRASGYYINLTCYENITSEKIPEKINQSIGLDYGIKTTLTTSRGEKYDISIGESKRLKGLSRKMHRQNKGSKNRYKTRIKLRKEYEYITNCRLDKANKVVSKLLRENEIVCMQDENIKGWQKGLFGKQVQYSALGTIKSKLINSAKVIVLDRLYPTTQLCYICGNKLELSLSEREYNCPVCGLIEDRDIKSAKTVLYLYYLLLILFGVPMEYRELTPVEIVPLPEELNSAKELNSKGKYGQRSRKPLALC